MTDQSPKYSIFSWYSDHFWIWVKKKVCTTFEVLIDRVRRLFLVHRPFRQFPTAQNSNFWKFYFFHIFWLSDISVHLEKSAIFHKISCFFDLSHILEVPKIEKKSKFSKNWILGCWKFSKVHAYQKSWVKSIGNYMKSCAHFFFTFEHKTMVFHWNSDWILRKFPIFSKFPQLQELISPWPLNRFQKIDPYLNSTLRDLSIALCFAVVRKK